MMYLLEGVHIGHTNDIQIVYVLCRICYTQKVVYVQYILAVFTGHFIPIIKAFEAHTPEYNYQF